PQPCAAAEDHECKCPPGYGCSGDTCLSCHRLRSCESGQELERIGIVSFSFQCKPCGNGTFSSSRNSWCRNWT
ncbi:TNR18 factor, partial [Pycnonotus jocosus]|nr:TNR18 factor [Pycnonotus jocosus]